MIQTWLILLAINFAACVIIAVGLNFGRLIAKIAATLTSLLILSVAIWLVWLPENIIDVVIVATQLVWLASIGRVFYSKNVFNYIKKTTVKDSSMFFLTTFALLLASYAVSEGVINLSETEPVYVVFTTVMSGLLFASTLVSIFSYKINKFDLPKDDLPTVTLAIPARNETHALDDNLVAALSSNYDKLEILVLDDCSQDSTADIIKHYAHDGVRFVQGAEPATSWLGKNQAYSKLLEEASGDYVLFCGVDVILSVDSVSKLIDHVRGNNLKMVSVLPQRLNLDILAHIIQPMRYFWQLAIPRFATNYPPVLSSCWLIEREAANKLGGFNAVKNSIIPESYFARRLAKKNQYQYIIGDVRLGITTRKRPKSQLDTAVRTLYPMLNRSMAKAWLALILIAGLFVAPFVVFAANLGDISQTYIWIPVLIYTSVNVIILTRVAPVAWFMGLITFPFAMLSEALLMMVSAWQYEYGKISWKGRNVCVPVMKRISKPKTN